MDQMRLDPQDKLTPPTPRTRCQQNTLSPQNKKVPAPPPPQDNFWNSAKDSRLPKRCTARGCRRCEGCRVLTETRNERDGRLWNVVGLKKVSRGLGIVSIRVLVLKPFSRVAPRPTSVLRSCKVSGYLSGLQSDCGVVSAFSHHLDAVRGCWRGSETFTMNFQLLAFAKRCNVRRVHFSPTCSSSIDRLLALERLRERDRVDPGAGLGRSRSGTGSIQERDRVDPGAGLGPRVGVHDW